MSHKNGQELHVVGGGGVGEGVTIWMGDQGLENFGIIHCE
jgi:hypothetical protein